MGDAARKVLDEALRLSEGERAEVASELLASLDGDADADWAEAWEAEIDARVRALDDGRVETTTWGEIRDRLRARRRRP